MLKEGDAVRDRSKPAVGQRDRSLESTSSSPSAARDVKSQGRFQDELARARREMVLLRQDLSAQLEILARLSAQAQNSGSDRNLIRWEQLKLPVLLITVVATILLVAMSLWPRSGPGMGFLLDVVAMYEDSGEVDKAIYLLDKAAETGVRDLTTLARMGALYSRLGEHHKAIDMLSGVVERAPKNKAYRLDLARAYGNAGRRFEAIDEYEILLKGNATDTRYLTELAEQYVGLQQYEQALAAYQRVLAIEPGNWQAHYHQGAIYRWLREYDLAIEQYERSLELNPGNYWSWLNLGWSYAGKNDQAKAMAQYRRAAELSPELPDAFYYQGEAMVAQGLLLDAITPYQKAIERDSQYSLAHMGLGKVYLFLGECSKSDPHFREVLRSDPGSLDAKEGLLACSGSQE